MLFDKIVRITFVSSVYAQDGKLVIGCDNNIIGKGKVPSEEVRFGRLTRNQSLLVGRKTWDLLPEESKPFDKNQPMEKSRQTIIVTRNKDFHVDDSRVAIAHSFDEAVQLAKSGNVWVIGGAEMYNLALPCADYLYHTAIEARLAGNVFFPEYERNRWRSIYQKFYHANCIEAPEDQFDTRHLIFDRRW